MGMVGGGELQTTGGHTTVSFSDMRANSHCDAKIIDASLDSVRNPCVVLFSGHAAARLVLQGTETFFGEFPGIGLHHVSWDDSAPAALKSAKLPVRYVGIYATSQVKGIAQLMELVSPNPLIVVPFGNDSQSRLRLLRTATGSGAPTVALGEAGARNAALLAIAMWAAGAKPALRKPLDAFRARQTATVRKMRLPAA